MHTMKSRWIRVAGVLLMTAALAMLATTAEAQRKFISIATGGTGGVYFVYGGALASLITKNIKDVEATAEVTAASVANMQLIQAKKADLAFTLADTLYDAFFGLEVFKATGAVKTFALAVLYTNFTHVGTIEGTGITKVEDLKGKRVSTGAPGSGTEVIANRILQAYGIDPEKDITRARLGIAETVAAMQDRKIDAFIWSGGVPTGAVLSLAKTPGIKLKLLPHSEAVAVLNKKWSGLYFETVIPKGPYGLAEDVPVVGVFNVLVARDGIEDELAYQIIQLMFDRQEDLIKAHPEARNLTLKTAIVGSPVPFHPGAIRFYCEKGVWTATRC